jgi:hypothetical protein
MPIAERLWVEFLAPKKAFDETFPDSLTIRSALFTDFAAHATGAFVKFRADQNEMSGCPAGLGARHH